MFETGVQNVDRILGGSIPEGLLLVGPAGSGKTTLSLQTALVQGISRLPSEARSRRRGTREDET
jgi:KaiC/GvpD/RAD55 family RecA-like ATPase